LDKVYEGEEALGVVLESEPGGIAFFINIDGSNQE